MKRDVHDRCLIDGVEYEQTVIRLRAVANVVTSGTGRVVPTQVYSSADIETANPNLIAKLFTACFEHKRVDVRIVGRIKAQVGQGMIMEKGQYGTDGELATFELNFGDAIRFEG